MVNIQNGKKKTEIILKNPPTLITGLKFCSMCSKHNHFRKVYTLIIKRSKFRGNCEKKPKKYANTVKFV